MPDMIFLHKLPKMTFKGLLALGSLTLLLPSTMALADTPTIADAKAYHRGNNVYDFTVTVRHQDTGWDHWVDRWDVLTPNGEFIKWRVILHPRPNAREVTRHLRRVKVPEGLEHVLIRANDTQDGLGPTVTLPLPK